MTDKPVFEAFLALGHALQTHDINPAQVNLTMGFEDAHALKRAIEAEFHPKAAPDWASLSLFDGHYKPPPGEVCKLNGIAVVVDADRKRKGTK